MQQKYIQELELIKYNVYHECNPYTPMFFDVHGIINKTIGYGKHAFTISVLQSENQSNLYFKDNSKVLFEVLDSANNPIYSGHTNISHVNGSSFGYFYIERDKLETYNEIYNGPAKLVIVGELTGPGLPSQWRNSYNIRTQIPFVIRKQHPNESKILFEQTPSINISSSQELLSSEDADPPIDALQTYEDFDIHSFDKLQTYSGELKHVNISYRLSSSLKATEQWEELGNFPISSSLEELCADLTRSAIIDYSPGGDKGYTPIGRGSRLKYWYGPKVSGAWSSGSGTFGIERDSLQLAGTMGIHGIVRKTVTDEDYVLQLDFSGSGGYEIVTSKTLSNLTDPSRGSFVNHDSAGDWDVLLSQSFNNFEPSNSLGPNVYGDIQSGSAGSFYRHTFSVPSGSYFAVRLNCFGNSASFANVSVKHDPQHGVNPPSYYYITPTPKLEFNEDVIEYKYKFYNINYEPAIQYNFYPVKELNIQSSTVSIPGIEHLSRKAQIGLRLRNQSDDNTTVLHGLIAETCLSSSNSNTFISPQGNISVYSQCYPPPEANSSSISTPLMTKVLIGGADTQPCSASSYGAVLGGNNDYNDVILRGKTGIGNFDPYQKEHPQATLHVKGDIIAENYVVSSSVTHMTTSYQSGSTAWGDSTWDEHIFTGSLSIHGRPGDTTSEGQLTDAIRITRGDLMFANSGSQYIIFDNANWVTSATKQYIGTADNDEMIISNTKNIIFDIDDSADRAYFGNPVTIGQVTPSNSNPGSSVKLDVHGDISASGDIYGVGKLYLRDGVNAGTSSIDHNGAAFFGSTSPSEIGKPSFDMVGSHASLQLPGFNFANDLHKINTTDPDINIRGVVKNTIGTSYSGAPSVLFFSGSTTNVALGTEKAVTFDFTDTGKVKLGINKTYPTTELEVKGDISASGQYYGEQILVTHHFSDIAETTERFLPAPSYFIDGTGNSMITRWIAPYDGELEKILVNSAGTPGSTTMKLYAGTDATTEKDSETVNMSSADTTYTFAFESGSTISAGDLVRVSYNASADSDGVSFTCVWKYKIT